MLRRKAVLLAVTALICAVLTQAAPGATAATTLAAPTSLSSSSQSTTAIAVRWSTVTGASGYRVDYSTKTSLSGAKSVSTTAARTELTGLAAGTTYYLRVRAVTAKAQADSDVQELRVTIPERDAEISILAENRYSTSVPAVVRVTWAGARTGQSAAFVIQPKLYILAIGVSQYQNKTFTLGYPAKDAKDFVSVLHNQKGRLYRDVTAKILTDGEATKDDILDGLDWLRKETTSKDVAMLFLAGHGVNDTNGIYYFLPTNANPDKLLRTGVVFSDIGLHVGAPVAPGLATPEYLQAVVARLRGDPR